MSDRSKIEWTDATWTPIRARRRDTGKVGVHCERVSEACKNCYAAKFNKRNLPSHGTGLDFTVPNREMVDIFVDEEMLLQPLRWRRGRKIFVCSQTDLFGEFVKDEIIDRVFAVMALAKQHTFQVLTKRPERMMRWFQCSPGQASRQMLSNWVFTRVVLQAHRLSFIEGTILQKWPLPNVWLGVTAENQETADKRIPLLLQTPAAKRFVSVEPMLGPVDLTRRLVVPHNAPVNLLWPQGCVDHASGHCLGVCPGRWNGLHQVICGGESGPGARPMHPDWARSLRDQCQAAGVAFFFKQWGEQCHWSQTTDQVSVTLGSHTDGPIKLGKKRAGRLLDGREWSEFPEATHG